jgi:hypothetical protein
VRQGVAGVSLQMGRASFSIGAVNMTSQRKVAILTDTIEKQSGLDIPA